MTGLARGLGGGDTGALTSAASRYPGRLQPLSLGECRKTRPLGLIPGTPPVLRTLVAIAGSVTFGKFVAESLLLGNHPQGF